MNQESLILGLIQRLTSSGHFLSHLIAKAYDSLRRRNFLCAKCSES